MAQSFEETAHLSIDQSKYRQNYDRIFKKDKSSFSPIDEFKRIQRETEEQIDKVKVILPGHHPERILEARIARAIELLQSDCHKNCSVDGIPGCKKLGCSNQTLIQILRGEE